MYRDFGRAYTFAECVNATEDGSQGQGADASLHDGAAVSVANVTMAECKLAYFTSHLTVRDYPRVLVDSSTFRHGKVEGVDGFGLLATV